MLEIRHKQNECIGCAQCVEVAPDHWFLDDNGMAQLLNPTGQWETLTLGEAFDVDRQMLQLAEESCPVDIIKVYQRSRR